MNEKRISSLNSILIKYEVTITFKFVASRFEHILRIPVHKKYYYKLWSGVIFHHLCSKTHSHKIVLQFHRCEFKGF